MNPIRILLLATTSLAMLSAGSASAQSIADIDRADTVIFENTEGKVATPDNMNPYLPNQNLQYGMWQTVQESLFYYNYETGESVPWLAESATYNDDNTAVTIKLRSGVTWSDGTPFSARDVVFTIQMLKDNEGVLYSQDMRKWVESVSASDDLTVEIQLTDINPRFILDFFSVRLWRSVFIVPEHIWKDVDPTTFSNFDLDAGLPLGTGPYRLVRSSETETVFDRRDDWWAAETGFHALPAPQRAIWVGIPTEDARAATAARGEADAFWVLGRGSFEVAQRQNADLMGWTADLPYAYLDPCPRYISLNNVRAPFDQADFRKAVSVALNRDDIVRIALEGVSDPARSLFPEYKPLTDFLDANAGILEGEPNASFDLARSDELMSGMGYAKDGDGLWADGDGNRPSFAINTWTDELDMMKMGPVIERQLREAGFDARFEPMARATFFSDVTLGNTQAQIIGMCGSVSDPVRTFGLLHSRFAAPLGEPSATLHSASRFQNSELDALIDQMQKLQASHPDFDGLASSALDIVNGEMPGIPLVQARLLTPFSEKYWTNWPSADNNYIQPGHWWLTGHQLIISLQPAQ